MIQYITLFLNIFMLSKGPQDVPSSRALLYIVLISAPLLNVLAQYPLIALSQNIGANVFGVVLTFLFVRLVLDAAKMTARFQQTMITILAVESIVALLLWPICWLVPDMLTLLKEGVVSQGLLLISLLGIYHMFVLGSIFRHALSIRLLYGVFISIAYHVTISGITNLVFAASTN